MYPTSSNTAPNASTPTSTANSANFNNAVGNLTDVGAYTGTTSPYGVFDMGGDVWQWNDANGGGVAGSRGGSFADTSYDLQSDVGSGSVPQYYTPETGFRLMMVPEPSSMLLAVVGCVAAFVLRKRFK